MFAAGYRESVKVKAYSSDTTPRQWEVLRPLIRDSHTGRPIQLPLKDVADAIFYKFANGCKWRDLPHDFPNYKRVHEWFVKWRDDGTWDRVLDHLRRAARAAAGRDPEPSEGCLDSQTVKAAATGGARGYDGGKATNGRKRHVLVDTLGLLLAVTVTAGSVSDSAGAIDLPRAQVFPTTHQRLAALHADGAYNRDVLKDYLNGPACPRALELVVRAKPVGARGFVPVRKRWVVERTFAWFGKYRGLARDYETDPRSSEASLKAAMIHVILQRKLQLNTPSSESQVLNRAA